MGRLASLNKHLKSYDRELYAVCHKTPRIDVYRQNRDKLSPPHFIFTLTEDWTTKTRPVEWGIEVVLARLKAHDLWNSSNFFKERAAEMEAAEQSEERSRKNNIEAFMQDFRRQFVKATDGVGIANMNKTISKGKF